MKRFFTFLLLIFGVFFSFSQNLIQNSSFEQYTTCPNNGGQLTRATYWLNPTNGTTDYFHSCTSNPKMSTPFSTTIGYQIPRTGNAYLGLNLYSTISIIREYFYTELITRLKSGRRYEVKFYVNLADSVKYGINRIGAYLSAHIPVPLVFVGTGPLSMYTPQINNPLDRVILDKEAWTEISGVYTATGGERYITFGNFYVDDSVATMNTPPVNTIYVSSYYLFDDMSVIELNDYDIEVSQIAVNEVCYGVQDTVSITLTNHADSAIDFTVDTVLLNLNLAVNGSLINSYSYEFNNNNLLGTALQPDSSVRIEITGVDFSIIDSLYTLSVISSMKRDINSLNDTLKTTHTPRMAVGTISPLPKEVCYGSSIELIAPNSIGAGNWQFSDDGLIFQNFQPNDTINQVLYRPTYFRYQVCNVLLSDTFLVAVNRPPSATDTSFNSCAYNWVLTPRIELPKQTFEWYYGSDTTVFFYKGDTLTVTDTLNSFFYIKSVVDSCTSNEFSMVRLLWENCETPDTIKEIQLVIPNVITPNGDGINDFFIYTIDSNQTIETIIFDRWGREVANWKGNLPWFAEKVEAGTYFIVSKINGRDYKSTLSVLK